MRGDRNLGSDAILRFLALLDAVDEGRVSEIRAERAARAPHHRVTAPSFSGARAPRSPS